MIADDYTKRKTAGNQRSNAQNERIAGELFAVLRRGGGWTFLQNIDPERGIGPSDWLAPGAPFRFPSHLNGRRNLYWSINPAYTPIVEADRAAPKNAGRSDAQIMRWTASKNSSISAVNALIADIDGKDYALPTQDEIAAAYNQIKAEMYERLATGQLSHPTPEAGLLNQAFNRAQEIKYKVSPAKYRALALDAIKKMPLRPSVLVDSGGGYQCYWLFAEPFIIGEGDSAHVRSYIADIYRRWNSYTGGDPACKDLRRIFRIPGTYNVKPKYSPNFPIASFVWCDLALTYTIDQIVATLPVSRPVPTFTHTEPAPSPTKHTITAGRRPHGEQPQLSSFAVRVAAVYNGQRSIVDALLAVGYTSADSGRMGRPGEADSRSVQISEDKNGSFHHSSNDPLFGEHLRRPFDVVCVYEFGGDYAAAAAALGPPLGVLTPAQLAHVIECARRLVAVGAWSQFSASERTWETDRKLFSLLIDHMERLQKTTIRLTHRALLAAKNSHGHNMLAGSPSTVSKWIERCNGKLFHADTQNGDTTYRLNIEVVTKSNTTCTNSDSQVVFDLVTTYQRYKADDAYQARATAPAVRDAIAAKKAQLCADNPRYQSAAIAHHAALASKPTTAAEWRGLMGNDHYTAYRELVREAAADFLPSLSTEAILVLGYVLANPGAIRRDIAAALALKRSTVAGILRKLEMWAAVDSDDAGSTKEYMAAPDAFAYVDALTPSCRSHQAGLHRYEKSAAKAQLYAERLSRDSQDETERRVSAKRAQRAAQRRYDALTILHPDWSHEQITKHIWSGWMPSPKAPQAPAIGSPGALAWARLMELTGKGLLTADEFGELQQLDKALGAGVAGRHGEVAYDRPNRW